MAKVTGARKNGKFKAVGTAPSINKTPVGNSTPPLPYPVMQDLSGSVGIVPNVNFNGDPSYVLNQSTQPETTGDAPGSAKGIKSGTVSDEVKPVQGSSTVRIDGKPVIREMDPCTLNKENCPGIYTTQPAPSSPQAASNSEVSPQTEEESDWWDAASPWVHGALGVASFVPGLSVVTGGLDAVIYGLEGNYGEALMSAGSMLPGGKVATTAGKVVKGASKVNKVKKGVQAGGTGRKARRAKTSGQKAGKDGAKILPRKKKKKGDKPDDDCPKNGASGGTKSSSDKPVHYGTGEEILAQTDFEIEGEIPFTWTRTYRSGSECEDWGLLGARWATPYSASLSLSAQGIVYHEASGRALRLPLLAVGQTHDHAIEGFILHRDSEDGFTLTWRDGSIDTFKQGPHGWLPHGYDGANAMRKPQPPEQVIRCYLTRSIERDGRGLTIERLHDARPGEPLLRIQRDDGLRLEALRDEAATILTHGNPQQPDPNEPPRIGCVVQILPGGHRVCHVSYRYEAEPTLPKPVNGNLPKAHEAFETLPRRANLVEQHNALGHSRRYAYHHHLLQRCSDYNGFHYRLGWVSLAQLRETWAGSLIDAEELATLNPITLYNSYQARATGSSAEDGSDTVRIDYLDEETSRVTEPDGGVLEYTFDHNWLATEVRRIPANGGPAQSLGHREWDDEGQLTAEIDALGNTTRYTYDKAGNLTSVTDALGHTTTLAYTQDNQPETITDALGHTTRQSFDDAGHLIEQCDPLDQTTRYTYDEAGHLIQLTDANGGTKQLTYDDNGNLASYTDCSGHTTHYAYDEAGRLTTLTDPLGQLTHYRYDALGRLLEITYPDRAHEHFEYDPQGNLTAHTNALGQVTRYRYNGQGLPVARIDTKGQILTYHYDTALRLVELINAKGESYAFTYDETSRLASETGFDGKRTTYQYDTAGQLSASECNGVRTEFHRDSMGQLLAKITPEGHSRFAYDPLGRLTAVLTPQAEQRYAYDPLGQLIEERHQYMLEPAVPPQAPKPSAAFKLRHAYDAMGNRIRSVLPNGRVVDTLRYGPGHWHATHWSGRTIADLERDSLHRETRRELGQATERLSASRDYDPQSRLAAMTLNQGEKKLRERRYRYDLEGNLTRIDDRQQGITHYAYDPLGQLLSAVKPDLKETFAFDPAGNMVDRLEKEKLKRESETEAPPTQPSGLTHVRNNRLEHYNNIDYEYDIQGNTVVKRLNPLPELSTQAANETATLDFVYDLDNRLVQVTKQWARACITAHYVYDAFGRRIAKTVSEAHWAQDDQKDQAIDNAPEKTTWFLWDDDNLLQEIQTDKTVTYLYEPESFVPLARIESDEGHADYHPDSVHIPPVEAWQMLEDPDKCERHVRLWQREQAWQAEQAHQTLWKARQEKAKQNETNDRIHYYHCDHLGTPLELYDESGHAVWSARYKAWGKIYRYDAKEIDQPLRFQGQYEDEETGLYYNRHRYYDADAGRYITQDPVGLLGGLNLYMYAPNPISWIDPWGLNAKPETAMEFEKRISNMPSSERVIAVKGKAQKVAIKNNWIKDNKLSQRNGRDVYRTPNGELRAVDTQHGRIEYTDNKGRHLGEYNIDGEQTKPADKKGQHDLSGC